MSDWEEIKRLAADFQRTQTSHTLQKISERNCIDIIKKLTELKLIELIYTCDGKEFLTPSHLQKEIEDEVYVNGGRVHLHDLAAALNVDYQHVENTSKQIVADKPTEYNLILGQIIHSTYKTTLEKQIYDTMICTGQLGIADFAKSIDLPSEFLATLVKELMPNVVDDFVVSQDERTYYTTDMMDQYKSIIAGTLIAISKPTTIAAIMKRLEIPERLFTSIVDGLVKEGRIDALVDSRVYTPAVYAKEQNDWVDNFYSSNSYIEYDVLLRKDIKQPKVFMKKRFPDGVQLKTCFVSPTLISQVEALIEDCIATNSLIDISSILPPSIQTEDIEQLLNDIFKKKKQLGSSCLVINQTNVCSLGYIATCKQSFNRMMELRAKEHLQEGKLMNHFLGCNQISKTAKKKQQQEQNPDARKDEATLSLEKDEKKDSNVDKKEVAESGDHELAKQEEGTKKKPIELDELTAEDLKREKRSKKGKANERSEKVESDDELDNTKKSKSRKSGGGVQGREIKQKATKKKYLPGSKGKQAMNEDSDSDTKPSASSKQPRSNKGRAARRGVSPEPQPNTGKTTNDTSRAKQTSQPEKEPLTFLDSEGLISKIREQTRDAGEFSHELFKAISDMLEADLNKSYEVVARRVLDEYLRREAEKDVDTDEDAEIDLIE